MKSINWMTPLTTTDAFRSGEGQMGTKHKFLTKRNIVAASFSCVLIIWGVIFFSLEPISAQANVIMTLAQEPLDAGHVQNSPDCPPDYNPGAYLYTETDFKGACFHTSGDIADLGQTPLGDNNVSSIQLRGWYMVKLYEHPNWKGRTREVTVDEGDLDKELLGGKYSSLRIYPNKKPELVSNISVVSVEDYYLGKCKLNEEYYVDRDYVFTGFSKDKYDDLWCIKTANKDKDNTLSEFLTFELNEPAIVYIYFDRRIRNLPDWANGLFEETENEAYVSDNNMDSFVIYACNSHPGVITLGGAKQGGSRGTKAMYLVAFREGVWSDDLCTGVQAPATPTYTPTHTPSPTLTPTPTITPTPALTGDVNGDGQVDIFDLTFVAARYNTNDLVADINGDGLVDIFDLVIVANNYGR
jgi:hypothetical protein